MRNIVRVMSVAMVLALLVGVLGTSSVLAAGARDAQWVVSVTYQNVGTGAATVVIDFYGEGNGTPVNFNPLGAGNTLPAGAGASLFIGSVTGLGTGQWRGSAVMSSDQPLVATVVQFSQAANFKMRLLSNGFQAGSNQFLVATALFNKFNRTTVFSIQNTESEDVTATVKLYDADNAGALAATKSWDIPAGSSKYVEMDKPELTGLPAGLAVFNGSAIVTAVKKSDGTTAANVVAAASELYTNKNVAANFEGVPLANAANTIYMATALCRQFGLDTFYAVQNASLTDSATISIKYFDTAGVEYANENNPAPIGPGQKRSISTCAATPVAGKTMPGFTGSSVVTSVGAPIVVVGKAQGQANPPAGPATVDVFTAFLGERAGSSKLAVPFVRWASDANFNSPTNVGGKQRTFLAVQNLESSQITVHVNYFGKDGSQAGTETLTLQPFAKGSSNAQSAGALGQAGMNDGEFGYYPGGLFGGGAIIEADAANPAAKFIAIARVQNPGAGEDYNGMAVP